MGSDAVTEPETARRKIAVVPQEGRPLLLQTPSERMVLYLASRGLGYGMAKGQS